MHDNYCLYFKWKEDSNLEISYDEKNYDSLSNYISFISVPTRILVSSDLAIFDMIVRKFNMSRYWCHWCMLPVTEWKVVIMKNVMHGPYN